MINGVGSSNPTRIGQTQDNKVGKTAEIGAPASATAKAETAPTSLISALAESGPPIDADKIKAIKAAIAQGRYPIDPKAIAQKMIEFDLPKGNA